jgi:hypothetical protein
LIKIAPVALEEMSKVGTFMDRQQMLSNVNSSPDNRC